jgi:hypothetical protein
VKLMADYGAFPLWAIGGQAPLPLSGDYFWTSEPSSQWVAPSVGSFGSSEPPSDEVSWSDDHFWFGGLSPDALPLSASLIVALKGWSDDHDRLLGPTFEWPSEQAKVAFVADGRRLLARISQELGSDYEVVYFDEVTGRVEDE